ncbi:RHS repeat domain-containing protein [Rubrivirga sp.]|uniref:RHS repeat domain-containing protein n=1 Tax=Rubrivirga sp. TaxID=1885344 RepID=UPI003B52369A
MRSYTAFGELAEQRVVRDAGPGRVGLAEVFRRSYAHDESGRITSVEDSRWARGPSGPEAATLVFGHDVDGRLASSVVPDRGLTAYEADAAGNVPAAPVRLPQLPVADGGTGDRQRVVAVRVAAGWTLGYDADGNLLSKRSVAGPEAWRYVYDAAGRLAEVWRGDGPGETCVGRYGYDVLGRRVARQAWSEDRSGLTERVVWDGDVPAERRRVERAPQALGVASAAVSVRTYAFEGLEPLALLDDEEGVAVIECDQVGQPGLAVDRDGALVWEGRFDPWGGEVAVGPVEPGGPEVEVRFPGQVADAESGLRYNRHRYYDPRTRAYVRNDLMGIEGGASASRLCGPAHRRHRSARALWRTPYHASVAG